MCGIFGITGVDKASDAVRLGLYELQHRGQDSYGIAATDGIALKCKRFMGLVMQPLQHPLSEFLPGSMALGQTRYTTAGQVSIENAQPILADTKYGQLVMVHNGNLTNHLSLREQLKQRGAAFQGDADTETIMQLIVHSGSPTLIGAIKEALCEIKGAYSLIFLTPSMMLGVCDPSNVRPLVLGKISSYGYALASEDCAFRHCGADKVRDLRPGEILIIKDGATQTENFNARSRSLCIFEKVYLSKPDSEGIYEMRYQSGTLLGEQDSGLEADLAFGIPDSGIVAALGYSHKKGIPYQQGLIRNHYSGRTFIDPEAEKRAGKVELKLAPVRGVIKGKRVVLVDDTIVRGTTSRKIVEMVWDAGAEEVHFRVAAPPTTHSCYSGIDTPTEAELIASGMDVDEVRKYINATSLRYLSLDSLHKAAGGKKLGWCDACFTGNYPPDTSPIIQIAH